MWSLLLLVAVCTSRPHVAVSGEGFRGLTSGYPKKDLVVKMISLRHHMKKSTPRRRRNYKSIYVFSVDPVFMQTALEVLHRAGDDLLSASMPCRSLNTDEGSGLVGWRLSRLFS